ncbi:MAG: helix-turn-helix transcriptional regulator [Pseudomonadota bacterium]
MAKSTDDVDAHIGARVRMRRMMAGISQEQLGDALGLTFQQIQKYEKGLNRIGAGRLYRIAQVLGVSVEFFYEGLPQNRAHAESELDERRSAEMMAFLSSPEGYNLTNAFTKIRDASTRRRLLDLVRTIACANPAEEGPTVTKA